MEEHIIRRLTTNSDPNVIHKCINSLSEKGTSNYDVIEVLLIAMERVRGKDEIVVDGLKLMYEILERSPGDTERTFDQIRLIPRLLNLTNSSWVHVVAHSVFHDRLSNQCVDLAPLLVKGLDDYGKEEDICAVGAALDALYQCAADQQNVSLDAERKTRAVFERIIPYTFNRELSTLTQANFISAIVSMGIFVQKNMRSWKSDKLYIEIMKSAIHAMPREIQRIIMDSKDQVSDDFFPYVLGFVNGYIKSHPIRPVRRVI